MTNLTPIPANSNRITFQSARQSGPGSSDRMLTDPIAGQQLARHALRVLRNYLHSQEAYVTRIRFGSRYSGAGADAVLLAFDEAARTEPALRDLQAGLAPIAIAHGEPADTFEITLAVYAEGGYGWLGRLYVYWEPDLNDMQLETYQVLREEGTPWMIALTTAAALA